MNNERFLLSWRVENDFMQNSVAIRWCEEILMNNFLKKTNEFLAQSIRSRAF